MTHQYHDTCNCGNVTFVVTLTRSLDTYAPRACDCDFCTSRGLVWLSDPEGGLELYSQLPMATLTQGSGQADFLSCTNCGVIVAVVCLFESGLKGNVNAGLLNESEQLQQPVKVSPKLLDPAEKIERWHKLWFSVTVHTGHKIPVEGRE